MGLLHRGRQRVGGVLLPAHRDHHHRRTDGRCRVRVQRTVSLPLLPECCNLTPVVPSSLPSLHSRFFVSSFFFYRHALIACKGTHCGSSFAGCCSCGCLPRATPARRPRGCTSAAATARVTAPRVYASVTTSATSATTATRWVVGALLAVHAVWSLRRYRVGCCAAPRLRQECNGVRRRRGRCCRTRVAVSVMRGATCRRRHYHDGCACSCAQLRQRRVYVQGVLSGPDV